MRPRSLTKTLSVQLTMLTRSEPNIAAKKPWTSKPFTSSDVSQRQNALRTRRNRPRVSSVTGRVSTTRMGRTTALISPRTRPAPSAAGTLATVIPGTISATREIANALRRPRKRNPIPRTLWLTSARDDGRERADPALGPARRLRPHRRRRAHGAEPVPGPPRLGRDPRLRDVAPLRARPPRSRRARLARRRAHDDARRPPRGDPGWAPVARARRRGRPDVRGLPALGPDPAGVVLRGPRGAPLVRSAARRPAPARARGSVGAPAMDPRQRRRLGRGGRGPGRQRPPGRARRRPGAVHALLPVPRRPRPRPAAPPRPPPARRRAIRPDGPAT